MKICTVLAVATAVVAGSSLVSSASAGVYEWNWHVGDPVKGGISNTGGAIESIYSSFNTATQHFTWNATFSNQITRGYTLAVNSGPNPKGHAGELALIYFDAESLSHPKVSVYAYNGLNSSTSYKDGNGALGGNQTPDRLMATGESSKIINIEAKNVGSRRELNLTLDVSTINAHFPLNPGPSGTDWSGVQFAESLGLWFHPVRGLDATYNSNGFLSGWSNTGEGWFDATDHNTTQVVPLPTAGLMGSLTLAGAIGVRRRRVLA